MPKSTILIGNGPSALDRSAGEEIDSFEQVVRFNRFRVAGYEESVGTRTDVWYTYHVGGKEWWNAERAAAGSVVIKMRRIEDVKAIQFLERAGTPVINCAGYAEITNYAKGRGIFPSKERAIDEGGRAFWSLGIIALGHFLFVLKTPQVALWGFDSFKKGWHYQRPEEEEIEKSEKFCPHDGEAEAELIEELVKDSRVFRL